MTTTTVTSALPSYVAALDNARAFAAGAEHASIIAYSAVRHSLPADERPAYNWTPDVHDDSPIAKLRRQVIRNAEKHESARNTLARATSPGTPERTLVEAVDNGEIDLSMLLATVPDAYGRISPFAVSVTNASTHRSYTSRNLTLHSAVSYARAEREQSNRAVVHFDTCG